MTLNKERLQDLYLHYKLFLLENCIPFWLKNGLDHKHGGLWTSLDRKGALYNTDKSVWFQGRAIWMFSRLYNTVEKREEWLSAAHLIHKFLMDHCFDQDRRMYFTVTGDGKPLQKRRYLFSETFAIIALAEYSQASRDQTALDEAKAIYNRVIDLYHHPDRLVPKINPQTRQTKSLALPMILLATTQTLREASPDPRYDELADEFLQVILQDFFKPGEKALFETVGVHGERLDSPQGRCINPGHSIEMAWFIMHEGVYRNSRKLIGRGLEILDYSLELGWDKEFGGLFYFVDIEGKPAEQLEWDMKLWWPHTEALYAVLLAYSLTADEKYAQWHEKIHDYSFAHYTDPEYGEWYGYLHRDGTVANTLKGSMYKGPFHLPRSLLLSVKLLEQMLNTKDMEGNQC